MDIYEFALKMEKDGEDFYRELAAKAGDKGLEGIFNMLADEEVRHFEILQQMQKNSAGNYEVQDSFAAVKNVFEKMREDSDGLKLDSNQAANYRKARDIEKDSAGFYREKAEEMSDETNKALLLKLAEEEERHYVILDNLADFVSQAEPGHWLENAEWHHMGEY